MDIDRIHRKMVERTPLKLRLCIEPDCGNVVQGRSDYCKAHKVGCKICGKRRESHGGTDSGYCWDCAKKQKLKRQYIQEARELVEGYTNAMTTRTFDAEFCRARIEYIQSRYL